MKRFLPLLLALLSLAPLFALAASPNVLVTVSDFTLDYSAPNRVVRLSPTTAGSAQRGLSDSSGQVTFTGVSPGIWTLTIEGVGVPSLLLRVPSSSATLSAASLVISQWSAPVASSLGASKAVVTASDRSLTSSGTTAAELGYVSGVTSALQTQMDAKQAGSANLASWSALATSSKQDALTGTSALTGSNATLNGWLKLQGQTNQIGDNGSALTFNGVAVGGGGDQVWTNASGVIAPAAGQTTNTLQFISGAADDATNVAAIFGSAEQWSTAVGYRDHRRLASFRNGTNEVAYINEGGAVTIGLGVGNAIQPGDGEVLSAWHAVSLGENSTAAFYVGGGLTDDDFDQCGYVYGAGNANSTANLSVNSFNTNGVQSQIRFFLQKTNGSGCIAISDEGNDVMRLEPMATNGASAIAYTFDTLNSLSTSGAKLASFKNATAEKTSIDKDGKVAATGGFSSTDTNAAVAIAATGWTNTMGRNAVVYFDGVGVTATVYNNAGTAIYTNATSLGGGSILLQPSGKVILSGTSVVGRAAPF